MILRNRVNVIRVGDETGRQQALEVMRAIYRDEKGWVQQDEKLISADDLTNPAVSWFVVRDDQTPVGVLRVLYEPPLDLYKTYGFKVVVKGIDLDAFIRSTRIAEIGRFAILPKYRSNIRAALGLMNAAVKDTLAREFTHYITDVFEGEQHSPYDFHTRVMGFTVVATHDTGELNCPCRRLTMLLDIRAGYKRLCSTNGMVYRAVTNGFTPEMIRFLTAPSSSPTIPASAS
jgi:hypothetical protein